MTWGLGHGAAWGGGPVQPDPKPTSVVAGPPASFDFTDEPDGVLVGPWEFYAHTTDGGVVTSVIESDPFSYFRVVGGLGWWRYDRDPAVGVPFKERGWAASPSQVVVGRNYRLLLIFVAPPDLVDLGQDELEVEAILAARANDDLTGYVAARARARWAGGIWTEPLTLEVASADGAPPTTLTTAVLDPARDPVDTWRAGPNGWAGLTLEVRGDDVAARLNGVLQATATFGGDSSKVGVLFRARRRKGAAWESVPAIVGFEAQTLRDLDRLGPAPTLLGSEHMEAPQVPTYHLPLAEWLDLGFLKRVGGRQFRTIQDVDAELPGSAKLGIRTGDVLRAVEPFVGQAFTQAVVDLAAARGRGGR